MNDRERELWVLNTETLYHWWKWTGLPLRKFLHRHREEIDRHIDSALQKGRCNA